MRERLPQDACITVGAGNYAVFPHTYYRYKGPGTSLAAISAKLEHPERTVVCYAGDGCFQMNLQELGVAMQYRLGIVVLVFNNGIWGTIRAHQEREFPGRTIALGFENPEFAELARAYRGYGEVVASDAEFGPALNRALDFASTHSMPALLELRYDPDGIAPGATLSASARRRSRARRQAEAQPVHQHSNTMRAFFSDEQLLHEPRQFMRAGRLCEPTDVPARAAALQHALAARGIELAAPPDCGRAPLESVHSAAYLDFLASAYARWLELARPGFEPGSKCCRICRRTTTQGG